ncbi:MAG: hypothetical protein ACRDSK_05670 [Actinophytocola sp.]|uniref:hypothetical protein n=1 Tax=Actinophytocola sp. TaxID=1872138 RepID=UPI003D6ACDE4
MNSSANFLPLLDSLHTLLRDYPIHADMCSIEVNVETSERPAVLVQLAETDLTTTARGLLEWQRTLAEGDIFASRTTDGMTLHLGVSGHLDTDNTLVEVWGEAPYDEPLIGAGLQPGERVSLPFEELAVWAVGLVGR